MQLDGKEKRIFSGWMFADSPGLNAVEHPVFDVWLTDCTRRAAHGAPNPAPQPPAGTGAGARRTDRPRRAGADPRRQASRSRTMPQLVAPSCRARAVDSESGSAASTSADAGCGPIGLSLPGLTIRARAGAGVGRQGMEVGLVGQRPRAACGIRARSISTVPNCCRCSVTNCVSSSEKPPCVRRAHEIDERHLAGVARGGEHALAEEGAAERHAVEPADQPPVLPGLDRVAVAGVEQVAVERRGSAVDPGGAPAGAATRRSRRSRPRSRCRCGSRSAPCADGAGQAPRHVHLVERQDAALLRLDPVERRDPRRSRPSERCRTRRPSAAPAA